MIPKKIVFLNTALFLVALSPALRAQQQQPTPKPLRFDFTPFIGYRSSVSFPIEPHVSGMNPRIVLDHSASYGASFGVRLEEDGLVEVRWTRQGSHIQSEDLSPAIPRQHVTLDQFHADFSREYIVDDRRPWVRPFALLGVGATHVSSAAGNFTRFSLGAGGGVRFYPTRHVGFKIQAEWVPVFVDTHVAFVCGGGCVVHLASSLASQGEVLAGPILRF